MADSDAVRQQRRRRHLAGDHSACRRGCQAARVSLKIAPVPPGSGRDLDPSAALRDLAAQLREACAADPSNAALSREYRATLLALSPPREGGVEAEMRLLMAELSRPVKGQDWPDFDDRR
jgi:hypothetical protein